MAAFWERQEDETNRAYQAFCVYRDLGPTRSLKKAAKAFYGTETDPKLSQINTVKAWSSRFMWVSRAEAFDAERDRVDRIELEEHRRAMNERHRRLATFMQGKAFERLNSLKQGELPPSQIANVVNVAANLERLATGESTQNVNTHLTGDALAASPEWARTKAAIVGALRDHPAAMEAVVEALTSLEEDDVA